jgi:uncharacterized protein (TIGR03067 family)
MEDLMRQLALIALFALVATTGLAREDQSAKELAKLKGKWIASKQSISSPLNKELLSLILDLAIEKVEEDFVFPMKVEFVGDKAKFGKKRASVKIDPKQTPAHISITTSDKKTWLGIYRFDDDKLVIAFGDTKVRPMSFDESDKNRTALVRLQKD